MNEAHMRRPALPWIESLREWWPAGMVTAGLLLLIIPLLVTQVRWCDGHFVYMLDDTYIHMATARNLVLHGTWGVTRYGFTSAESSILWPLLLAGGFKVLGIQEVLPLAVNVVAGIGLVFVAQWVMRREAVARPVVFAALVALVLLPAIPVMVMTGMEHVLQGLLALLFVHFWLRSMVAPRSSSSWAPALSGLFLVAVRYESVLLVGVAVLLLLCTGRVRTALLTGVLASVPVVVFGLISMASGWQFLPNPLLVRLAEGHSGLLDLVQSQFMMAFGQLVQPGPLFMVVLLLTTWALVVREQGLRSRGGLVTGLVLSAALLHIGFARTWNHYGRYEAYLLVLTVYAVTVAASGSPLPARLAALVRGKQRVPLRWLGAGAVVSVLFAAVSCIALYAYIVAPVASFNIYSQQYQMARFIQQHYPDGYVAINDIGAISFFSDAKIYDLWGLATNEVWKAREAGVYDSDWISMATRRAGVDIAVVYDHLFERYGGLPDSWLSVGKWTIPLNVVCGDDTVSFYALDPAEVPRLSGALQQFSDSLPADIGQSGYYLDEGREQLG